MDFSLMSGYSPVKLEANTNDAITEAYSGDTTTGKGRNVLRSLQLSADAFTNKISYATKPFNGSKDVRSLLDSAMSDAAVRDRETVIASINQGQTREEATAPFMTDEYFNTWFEQLCKDVEAVVQ